MSYQDKTLTCRDCGATFVFSAGDQEFYAGKGFANEPGRCPSCRSARKASRDGGYGGGGGGGGGGYGRDRGPRAMFPAVCARCGKETQVPFEPRSDKPVYCSDCFAMERGRSGGSDRGRSGGNRW